MKLTAAQIKAIADGQALSTTHDTQTLAVALANSIQANERLTTEEVQPLLETLSALFSALTEPRNLD